MEYLSRAIMRQFRYPVVAGLVFAALLWFGLAASEAAAQTHPPPPVYDDVGEDSTEYDRVYAHPDYLCARVATSGADKGKIQCWGDPGNDRFPRTRPNLDKNKDAVGALSTHKFRHLVLLDNGGCGIIDDHTIHCWGLNSHQQFSPPENTIFSALAGTGNTVCGIIKHTRPTNRKIKCWGDDVYGLTTPPIEPFFVGVGQPGSFEMSGPLAGGNGVFCGLAWTGSGSRTDSNGYLPKCWGKPGGRLIPVGAQREGETGDSKAAKVVDSEGAYTTTPVMAVGRQVVCVLIHQTSVGKTPTAGQHAECWGDDRSPARQYGTRASDLGYIGLYGGDNSSVCGLMKNKEDIDCWPNTPLLNLSPGLSLGFGLSVGGQYLAMTTDPKKTLTLLGYPPGPLLDALPKYTKYDSAKDFSSKRESRLSLGFAPGDGTNNAERKAVKQPETTAKTEKWGNQSFVLPSTDGRAFWDLIDALPGGGHGIQVVLMLSIGLWVLWRARESPNRYYLTFLFAGVTGLGLWVIGIGHWNTVVSLACVGGGTLLITSKVTR